MVYDHIVKCGGVYYPAGVDVPDDNVEKAADVEKASVLLYEEEIPKKKPGRPKKEQ